MQTLQGTGFPVPDGLIPPLRRGRARNVGAEDICSVTVQDTAFAGSIVCTGQNRRCVSFIFKGYDKQWNQDRQSKTLDQA